MDKKIVHFNTPTISGATDAKHLNMQKRFLVKIRAFTRVKSGPLNLPSPAENEKR